MTNEELKKLMEGSSKIGEGIMIILKVAGNMKPEDRFDAVLLGNTASIIASANSLIGQRLLEIKTQ